jgi:hypothetical protein
MPPPVPFFPQILSTRESGFEVVGVARARFSRVDPRVCSALSQTVM